jgi:hypothetical protein
MVMAMEKPAELGTQMALAKGWLRRSTGKLRLQVLLMSKPMGALEQLLEKLIVKVVARRLS